jgi:triphosphatase
MKSLDPVSTTEPGLRRRREVSELLEQPDPGLLRSAKGAVGERVRAVAGRKLLVPLFEVRTRRRLFMLEQDGSLCGEIALDETAIHPASGEAPARLRRVEVEVPEAAAATVTPFVEQLRAACGLQPAGLSKYEAGLLSAGVRPPPAEELGATEIDPEQTIGDVALAVVRRHFGALLAREAGTRLGDDIEELHDMRVASRRLRASLQLFTDVLPAGVLALQDDLRWLGEALGAVRDLDVQLEQLEQWIAAADRPDQDALKGLRLLLQDQRREARASMLEALDSRRYTLFVNRCRRTLRARHTRRSGRAPLPARAVAPDLIESRLRRFRKRAERIGPDSPASAYHRLRIDVKRLRYALEFLVDLYPGRTRRLIERLVALQDILGLHQDAQVAHERLWQLASEHGSELPAETIFAMGEIAERYRHSMAELRNRFTPAYRRTKGKSWKSFLKRIEAQRPTPSGPTPSVPKPEDETRVEEAA